MSDRKLISSGSTFEKEIGYSRAVVQDNWVFVSGITGYDYKSMTISDSIVEQTEQCFKNLVETLAKAEASLEGVVRVHYIVPIASDFEKC
ncbi:Rid family hydrolase [Flavicella sp.]|uniref:Rid family hydrolase n=1 Tax=Flavicella sp. TaxID=2957742 RepID=UPI0030191E33